MRILLVSDSPFINSAYSLLSWRLAKMMQAAGHEVIYYGLTLHAQRFTYDGIEVLGNTEDTYGSTMLFAHVSNYKPDFVLIYKDPHIFDIGILKNLEAPPVLMAPVDTEPAHEALLARLPYAYRVLTMSRNGQTLLRQAGVKADYVPIMVDTDMFCPGDRMESRQRLDLPESVFVASFVGANYSNPSRKNIDAMLYAWAMWLEANRPAGLFQDAILLLHTRRDGSSYGGLNLSLLLRKLGLTERNVRITNTYEYIAGLPQERLVDIYRASDVYLALSGGEGANAPLLEAQACGRQAIGTEFTAHRDHLLSGYMIPSAPLRNEDGQLTANAGGELYWHEVGGFRFRPYAANITQALQAIALMPDDQKQQRQDVARDRATEFAIDRVWAKYWLPLLEGIEQDLNGNIAQKDTL